MSTLMILVTGYALIAAISAITLYLMGRGTFTRTDWWVYVALLLLWPLSLLLLIGTLVAEKIGEYRGKKKEERQKVIEARKIEQLRLLQKRSLHVVDTVCPDFEEDEKLAISNLMAELALTVESHVGERTLKMEMSRFERLPLDSVKGELNSLWEPPINEDVDLERAETLFSMAGRLQAPDDEWGIHMTKEFRKAVKELDKNLRGRVLDAITEICMKPMQLRGDTVKPLNGELDGYWRYRLGDYRLIYHPDPESHRIDLVSIGGRGQVYTH